MKKTKIILVTTITMLFLLGSCVSTKKYKTAMSNQQTWEQKYNDLQTSYSNLQKENEQLQSSTTNEKQSLSDQERALLTQQKKLQSLQALIDEERNAISNLKQEVCDAVKCFTPDQLTVEIMDGKLYVHMKDKLLFPSGSDMVSDSGKIAIQDLANVLDKSDLEIMIEGNTDTVPIHTVRNYDNWDLSAHRATSVSRLFIKDGMSPKRIIAAGRSYYLPLASNFTPDGRQENRRTDIILEPKLDKLWQLTQQDSTATSMNTKNQ
jgi:chemotaxis protein MotB